MKNIGYWSGWTEWRYGAANARPVTLAGSTKAKPILSSNKKQHVVEKAKEAVRSWQMSPFESEGAIRAGIRSGLCGQGHPWAQSDATARDVLAKVFSDLGIKRPTWEQGQREYSVARENCVRCGCDLTDEQIEARHGFCSEWCATSTRAHNGAVHRQVSRRVEAWARYSVAKAKVVEKPCAACGNLFKGAKDGTCYCSPECAGTDRRKLKDRSCAQCGLVFRPRSMGKASRFCSLPCYRTFGRTERFACRCHWCGKGFAGKKLNATACSPECRRRLNDMWRIESRGTRPRALSSSILDYLFRRQGLVVSGGETLSEEATHLIPAYAITADIFDGWFKRAA